MNEEIKESHIRSLYRLLGHEGHWSRVGALDYSQKVLNPKTGKESYVYEETLIQGEDALIEWGNRFNTRRNIFISRAYRDSNNTVLGTRVITLDLDPVRPKDTAATDAQHKAAIDAGRKILSRYGGGYLASSGNGALLLYRLADPITGIDLEAHYGKEKILFRELQELIGNDIKLDSTYYAPAVIKVIGSFSTKGDLALRRCSRFLDYPSVPYRNCTQLLERLNQIEYSKPVANTGVSVAQLQSAFNGDRSTADFHLVNYLKKSGVGPEVALQALQTNPLGRRDDEKDQARLISKIYGPISAPKSHKGSYSAQLFEQDCADGQIIRTGITILDHALGPLPKGEITTVSARSGFGKSSFACTVTEYWRKQGYRILYFSTEMQEFYITHKLFSIGSGVQLQKFIDKNFNDEERGRILSYEQELLRSSIVFCDEFQPTLQLVENKVIEHKPDVIVFDHLTQVGTHWEVVAQFVRGLKEIASKENVPVLNLVMLDEPGKDNKGNDLQSARGDVRGSKEILFISACFLVMSNPYPVKGQYQPVNIQIAKNRFGVSGLDVPVSVDKSTGKFSEGIEGPHDGQPDLR